MKDLRCPLCRLPVQLNSQGLACENRHQFDRAKEGYFNLLPVQNKHSREPGDAKEQLQARRQFLYAGFFSALKTRLQELLPCSSKSLLDIGCGEGYFTHAFAEALPFAQVYGVDIAKAGVRLAAKAAVDKGRNLFAVASSFDLPFANKSMDVITRIYAPSKDEELSRVIKPDGLLIIVTPAADHLIDLRRQIYAEIRPHEQPSVPTGFQQISQERLTGDLIINDQELCSSLLSMTPFAWRLTNELRLKLETEGFSDKYDFSISTYRRC